jgi:hypothetical protein
MGANSERKTFPKTPYPTAVATTIVVLVLRFVLVVAAIQPNVICSAKNGQKT